MFSGNQASDAKIQALIAKGRFKSALSHYLKAGQHVGAAQMYERLGQIDSAAAAYAEGKKYMRAGELWASLGSHEQAAAMFVKDGAFQQAGEELIAAGKLEQAAQAFVKAGEPGRGAELYEEAGVMDMAARLYAKSGRRDEAIRILLAIGQKETAARLCVESGLFEKAALIYEEMESFREAGDCYGKAGMREKAVEAYERAGALTPAIELCKELGWLQKAGDFYERLGDIPQATVCYSEAGDFASAGRILEAKQHLYEAAEQYAHDAHTAAHAAELFLVTYSTDTCWQFDARLPVCDVALAEGAKRAVVCLAGPEVLLFDYTGNRLWQFKVPMNVHARCAAVTADGAQVAIGTCKRSVYLLSAARELLWKREFEGEIRAVAFDETHGRVIAGCTNGQIKALTQEGSDAWVAPAEFKVWHLAVHQEKGRILAGCGDGQLYTIDLDGKLVWRQEAGDWVSRVALSPDGRYAATVVGQSELQLYDFETNQLIWKYVHNDVLQDVEFWRDERLLVGSNSGAFMLDFDRKCIWRGASEDWVTRIVAANDGQTVYFGSFKEGLTVVSLNECLLRAAHSYVQCGMLTEAAPLYEAKNELALALDLYGKTEAYGKAALLADKLEDIAKAAEFYEKDGQLEIAAQRFEQANLIERAASCYAAAGNKSKAGELVAQLGDSSRAAELYLECGELVTAGSLFVRAGAADRALSAYEQALSKGQLTEEGALDIGRLYLKKGQLDDSIHALQSITQNADLARQAVVLLAECFMGKSMFGLAADRYKQVLGENAEVSPATIEVFYGLGCAYELGGHYNQARDVFQRILVVDYYYKDVTARLLNIEEKSSIFSAPGGSAVGGGPGDVGATIMAPQSRYEVLRQLGEGGMGVVYLARDSKLDREVALKVLSSQLARDDQFRTRFVREARAVAALNHKNVVAVYDIGEERGESYIAMEYIKGSSMRKKLSTDGAMEPDEAVRIAKQIAAGLSEAHRQGIVHRDIKPENIMLTQDSGEVKIMDFGLARIEKASNLTMEGTVMGTLLYMAPEQVMGHTTGPAADIYAMGAMLFEMLTGTPPFTTGDIAFQHVNTIPPRVEEVAAAIPAALGDIVAKCLEKDPANRFADSTELLRALEDIA